MKSCAQELQSPRCPSLKKKPHPIQASQLQIDIVREVSIKYLHWLADFIESDHKPHLETVFNCSFLIKFNERPTAIEHNIK